MMASEASCSTGQDLGVSVVKDRVVVGGKILNNSDSSNNISLRTGEEFSLEFLQDRGGTRRVGNGNDMDVNHMIGTKSDVNGHLGYMEISSMLGLQRVDSVSSRGTADMVPAKGVMSVTSAPVIGSIPSLGQRGSGSGVLNDSQKGKIKFLCSAGGKILPRPSDGKLRYVGGETHIFSIQKNMSFAEFVKRTSEFCSQPYTIKYQLPGEDLDSLISVGSDEDLQNMIEEFNGLGSRDGSSRLRIFLVPLSESESVITSEASANLQTNSDFQYVAAVNGIVDNDSIRNNDAHIKSSLDQNPSLPINHSPFFNTLEDLDVLNNSNVTPNVSEPQIFATPSDPSLLVSPVLVPHDDLINGHAQVYNDPLSGSIEIPVLKGRAFHSENRILHPPDPVNVYVGSNESQLGIPHAFSDPQLQERGANSAFGSQDGSNFPSTLCFAPPPLPSQLLQGKSIEQLDSNHPQVLFEMPNVSPSVPYSRTEFLQIPIVSESLTKVHSNQTHQDTRMDPNKNIGLQNYHDLQVPNIPPASTAINPKTMPNVMMQPPLSNKWENYPAEFAINKQQTTSNQQQIYTGADNGEQRSNMPQANNMGISGTVSNYNNISDADQSLNDLLSHLPNVQLPSSHQIDKNGHMPMNPTIGTDGSMLETVAPDVSWMQVPTTDTGLRREVKFNDDKVNYSEQKVVNLGHEEHHGKPMGDVTEPIRSRMLDAASSNTAPSSPTEAEDTHSDSHIEDAATDSGSKDGPFSNALIAEMEADMYGLQIIKNDELEELKELGSGTYGTVYHGRWRGSDVAIKRIKKSCFSGRSSEQERLTNDFWREAKILSNLHHPNVVAFYGVVPDGPGGTLATVTEFMTHGSLRNVLIKKDRSLDRRRKLIIAMDAAFGMEYLHMKNIVHFDLKCDNLLVNMRDPQRPICKVGDFGLSRIKRNTLVSGGVRGTLPWMAPELLNGSTTKVSEKVDVFSFGITMWEILTGEEPYANMHCGAIIGGIVKDTLRPKIPEKCDPDWRMLMEQCWSADATVRPSFTEITNRLRTMSKALQANGSKKVQNV
uniref:serine/threonine-protein kinase CLA4 n=1 Tax=Erigeron canadensis TaxID=72917 RepID=UPI001CB8F296|nr:serine/threonine-protein kinase CLA4 [Erigeron canadensis]